jgi:hypothetical protein
MAIGIGKAILAGLTGAAQGAATLALAEDERRKEDTQLTFKAGLKAAETYQELRNESNKELNEELELVEIFKDTIVNGQPIGRAGATALVRGAKARGYDNPDEMLKDYTLSGEGTLEIQTPTKISVIPEGIDLEKDDGGFFAKGRTKSVVSDVESLFKASNISTKFEIPQKPKVSGITFARKDGGQLYEGFKYGAYEITDAAGNSKVVQGILNPELDPTKGRLFLNLETNKYEPVPANAVWRGETARKQINIEEDPSQFEMNATASAMYLKSDKDLPKNSAEFRDQVAAGVTLIDGLDRMSKYALKEQNYSGLVSVLGSISRGVKNEIAGFSFLFSNDNVSKADALEADSLNIRNPDGSVNNARALAVIDSLDTRINNIESITDTAERISRERELMETMALRLAIAEIVADGDARPSDFDVQSRLRNYLSNSGEAFIEKAKETIAKTKKTLATKRNVVSESPAIISARRNVEVKDLTDLERNATQHFLNMYAPTLESALPVPSFLQEGFDKSQVSTETVNPDQPIVEVVVNSAGQKVKRVIMPDGSYLKQGNSVLEVPATVDDSSILSVAIKKLKGTK